MNDKTLAPFALPTEQQVFGQPTQPAPETTEPRQKRRGRPPKTEATPKAKRRAGKQNAKPAEGFTLDQVAVLRGLSHEAFSVVTTIMKSIPDSCWREIADSLSALSPK